MINRIGAFVEHTDKQLNKSNKIEKNVLSSNFVVFILRVIIRRYTLFFRHYQNRLIRVQNIVCCMRTIFYLPNLY